MVSQMSKSYRLAVAILVFNEKKEILLVQNHHRGWEFPGGYVDENERLTEAAVREVKEETGLDIKITRLLGIEQNFKSYTIIHIFEGEEMGGKLTKSNENLDVGFFPYTDAKKMITINLYHNRLERCLNQDNIPFIM